MDSCTSDDDSDYDDEDCEDEFEEEDEKSSVPVDSKILSEIEINNS